jgi:hypothetical protein
MTGKPRRIFAPCSPSRRGWLKTRWYFSDSCSFSSPYTHSTAITLRRPDERTVFADTTQHPDTQTGDHPGREDWGEDVRNGCHRCW